MKPFAKTCLRGAGLTVAVAAGVLALAVWATPRLIMHKAMQAVGGEAPPQAVFPPPTDHRQRRIVMPSPDLLYGLCVWDVSKAPLRIRADLRGQHYASLAWYGQNSDNFHVINDQQAGAQALDLWLIGPKAYSLDKAPPAGAHLVSSPSSKGLLLMRVLVDGSEASMRAAQAARSTLSCEAFAGSGHRP